MKITKNIDNARRGKTMQNETKRGGTLTRKGPLLWKTSLHSLCYDN